MFRSMSELGLLVRDLRLRRGWTQAELSTRVGVSREWLNGFERGRRDPKVSAVLDLLNEFELTLDTVPIIRSAAVDEFVQALLARRSATPTADLPSLRNTMTHARTEKSRDE